VKHKQQHTYRLSFQNDVGSSIDPDMDDVAGWERNLKGAVTCYRLISLDDSLTIHVSEGGLPNRDEPDLPPSEFDEEEIAERAAEAEDAELWADFDESNAIFSFSNINDVDLTVQAIPDDDVDMA
jgi:hypothetical protein